MIENKLIGILGLGLTGQSAFEFLYKTFSNVICYDDKEETRESFINKYGIEFIKPPKDVIWQQLDKLLVSPGINPNHEIVRIAEANKIEITSDIELFFENIKNAIVVGITGTNGKSTTTALVHHIIKEAGFNYEIGGNIGKPILSLPQDKEGYILELSSYQLDLLKNIDINIAVLLNITPDHLERYGNMDNYIKSKMKIFSFMTEEDVAIISSDNYITQNIINIRPKIIHISTEQIPVGGVGIIDGIIYDNINESIILDLPFNDFLLGKHNAENISASYAICRLLKIPIDTILNGIKSFSGLPHRMQYLGTIKDIIFYNDSKATNADAGSKSLDILENIYWIAGGIAKSGGIESLKPYFKKIRKAYFYGQDKDLFATTANGVLEYEIFNTLEEATNKAFEDAIIDKNDIVKNILLAPAAASLDQFKNFEERGNKFISIYKSIVEKKTAMTKLSN